MIRIHQNEIILKAIIKSYINNQKLISNNQSIEYQKIFSINSTKEAKGYKLLVGGERINSSELVSKMLKEDPLNPKDVNLIDIKKKMFLLDVPQFFKDFFVQKINDGSIKNSETRYSVREPLSKNYLQAACFIRVLKNFKFELK